MDKIVEEVLTNLIKRVELLEQKPVNQSQKTGRNLPQATIGQIKYIQGLGGNPWTGMTKQEASKLIDTLQKRTKVQPKAKPKQEIKQEDSYSEGKSLTPEEIQEIGEENLL